MMEKPFIFVAGLGRCGTTAVMQMLHRAGLPCVGEWPAFELDELNHCAVDPTWLAQHQGKALKLLDPHLTPLPDGLHAVVIWLDRDFLEQARSQAKFITALMRIPPLSRHDVKRLAAVLRRDHTAATAVLSGHPTLRLTFEQIVGKPMVGHQIAQFLAPWWPYLDSRAMAAAVRPRPSGPSCAAGLDMELGMIAELSA